MARRAPEQMFLDRLGYGALVGTPPEDGDGESWTYHTTVLKAAFSRAAPGIDLERASVYPLKKIQQRFADTILIGRAKSNDVPIEEGSISKLHARIRIDGQQMFISDAGSSNGCEVNYQELTGERQLRDGDVVTIGRFNFRFYRAATLRDALRKAAQDL